MPIKNIVTGQRVTEEKQQRAKEFQRNMTPAALSALSGTYPKGHTSPKYDKLKSVCGFKVFIVGFAPFGDALRGEAGWGQDARREKALRELGLKIVRFRNDEVVRGVSTVVGKIRELIAK